MEVITRTQRSHKRFYWLLALLLGMISLRYSLQIDIPPVLLLAIILSMAVLGDLNEIACVCLCCIALHESIDLFYALGFCIVVIAVKYPKEIRLNPSIIPIFLMIVWELLHCFRADFSLRTFIVNCIPLLVLAVFMCLDARKIDYSFVVQAFAIALAVICLSLLLKLIYLADFNILKAFAGLQRLGHDASEVSLDGKGSIQTNTLGILCVLATTGLMQLRMAGSRSPKDMLLALFLMVFGALTASRTYLVCLALMLVLLLFSQQGDIKTKLRYLSGVCLLVLIALGLLYLIFPDLMEYYISRFQEADITTGRDVLMINYGKFIRTNPKVMFFGIGLNHFGDDLMTTYKVAGHVPHNGIQELVIAWGLEGLILFICLWLIMIWRSRHFCKNQKLINYIPLIIILIKAQAGQMLNSSYTMLTFSYAYLSMCQEFFLQHKGYSAFLPAPTPGKTVRRGSKLNNIISN